MTYTEWDAELEWKVRHVRTPEGARYYGKPIGSPITAADRAAARIRKRAGGSQSGRGGGSDPAPTPKPDSGSNAPQKPRQRVSPVKPDGGPKKERVSPTRPKRVPGLAAVDGPQNRERQSKPVTPDTKTARPQLYTYQRNNVVKLGLDDDKNEAVREAALRVAERRPLTAEQSTALADALRERAKGDGVKAPQKRSMLRAAQSFDAASARVRGEEFVPESVAGKKPVKTSAADMGEGDTVIIPDGRGGTLVGRVEMNERIMGGKLHRLVVVGEDGRMSSTLVDPKQSSYLLPDAPEPEPIPDPEPVDTPEDIQARLDTEGARAKRLADAAPAQEKALYFETSTIETLLDNGREALFKTKASGSTEPDDLTKTKRAVIKAIRAAANGDDLNGSAKLWGDRTALFWGGDQIIDPEKFENFSESTRAFMEGIRDEAVADMIAAVNNAFGMPGETAGAAVYRAMRSVIDRGPKDRSNQFDTLGRIRENIANDRGETVDDTPSIVPASEGSFKDRMAAYRAMLPPPDQIGKVKVRRMSYGTVSLADLEAGNLPEPKLREEVIEDIAPDGGPGETAMRHNQIVMVAGRELDAELANRIDNRLRAEGNDLSSLADRRRAAERKFEKTNAEYTASLQSAKDKAAQSFGYSSEQAIRDAMRAGEDGAMDALRKVLFEKKKFIDKDLERRFNDDMKEASAAEFAEAKYGKLYNSAKRDAAAELLSEIRETGGPGMEYEYAEASDYGIYGGRVPNPAPLGVLEEAMRRAESFYPKEWLEAWVEKSDGGYRIGHNSRGYHKQPMKSLTGRNFKGEIMLSEGPVNLSDGTAFDHVTVHEIGHGMETSVPGLRAMESAFLWSRTSAGLIGERTRTGGKTVTDGSPTYPDDFREPYTGKVYEGSSGNFEVFTTQVESLFAGSPYDDEGTRSWTLGVLALL